jgi:hypothetical protein
MALSLLGTAFVYFGVTLPAVPAHAAPKYAAILQILGAAVSMIAGLIIGIIARPRD